MIREITRQQIEIKTAQGERVVLIEAQPSDDFEIRHLPAAIPIPASRVRELATQYLPDTSAEIVVYGKDELTSEVDDVAWQLSLLGYGNLYVYRGGKRDWFGAGEYSESVHIAPATGTHVSFSGSEDDEERSKPVASRGRMVSSSVAPLLRSAGIVLATYAGLKLFRTLRKQRERMQRERMLGTDEASEIGVVPIESQRHRVVRIEENGENERDSSAFNHASGAE